MKRITFAVLFLSTLVGCQKGPAVAPVSGVVTQDGTPLPQAMVEFQPDTGAPSYAYTDEEGRYEIQYQTDRMGALLGLIAPLVATFWIAVIVTFVR